MNKILNINLGGMPFTINIDAYDHLEKYITTIRRHFSDSESCDEIIHDIEVRMGELFQESMKGSSIITNKELDEVIRIMGTPEDFGAESINDDYDDPLTDSSYTSRESHSRSGKRLFRDSEDKIIGGVCSGIAAYFGVQDPIWIRLIFVIFFFGAGIGPLIYILLWIMVPVAKTASDKLSMRGENINISNIAKTVEEEITELSKRITEIGKDLTSKKKSNDSTTSGDKEKHNILLRIIASVFAIIGSVFAMLFSVISKTSKSIFKITGGALALILGLLFIMLIVAITISLPTINYLGSDNFFLNKLGSLSLYLSFGIPIVFGLSYIMRFMLGYKLQKKWKQSLGVTWIAAIVLGAFSLVSTLTEYQSEGNITDTYSKSIQSDNIHISAIDDHPIDPIVSVFDIQLSDDHLLIDNVNLEIIKSDDHKMHITKTVSAQGNSQKDAIANAAKVNATFDIQEDGTIIIPEKISLPKNQKYRGQRVTYTLAIPKGKNILFDKSTANKILNSSFDISSTRPHDDEKYTWQIGDRGLFSSEYDQILNYELDIPIENISNLFIEGKFDIELVQDDHESIKIKGNKNQIENVKYSSFNGSVNINNENEKYHKPIKLYAHVSHLDQLNLQDVNYTRLEGLTQENLSIYSSGRGDVTGIMDIVNLHLKLEGNQKIDLMGKGQNIDIDLDYNTDLELGKYLVQHAQINGDLHRHGILNVDNTLSCSEQVLGNLEIIGKPTISNLSSNKVEQIN